MITDPKHSQMIRNLAKTMALIDACRELKLAHARKRHPDFNDTQIRALLNQEMLARKENAWKHPINY